MSLRKVERQFWQEGKMEDEQKMEGQEERKEKEEEQ